MRTTVDKGPVYTFVYMHAATRSVISEGVRQKKNKTAEDSGRLASRRHCVHMDPPTAMRARGGRGRRARSGIYALFPEVGQGSLITQALTCASRANRRANILLHDPPRNMLFCGECI